MTSSSEHDKPVSLSASAGDIVIDFVNGKLDYRRKFGGGKNQALSKAVGLHKAKQPLRVFDATAGLGRDSFVLACLGATVLGCERHSQVFSALHDGLQRALDDAGLKTGSNGLSFSLRDQSSSGQNSGQGNDNGGNARRLIISEDESVAAIPVGRGYGRMLGSSSGVDIRV